ncbi:MAG: ribonuclease J [Dinoroseobacter sp.]|nr:ribonuclease J [Dinoroseobacter sp.]
MSGERLIYLPLGGAGEIGMNAYVYGYGPEGAERYILVDLGVTFPDMDGSPGVDLILPDMAWLMDRADRLDGVFVTHAHEDHVGGVGILAAQLNAPIYARSFTAAIARRKLEERGHDPDMVQVCDAWPSTTDVGPFKVGFLPVSHSIPQASGMVIDTPAGRLVHTGDFKLDPTPGLGEPFDPELWASVAEGGVRALICDSTNVFSAQPGRSEAEVAPRLKDFISEASGMVVATTFASNLARVKALAEAGIAAGRSVCLLGRAMRRMVQTAEETSVMAGFPSTIGPEDATQVPRENLMLIVTGSQGERRAASAALSRGKYLGLEMQEGDTFLFSSKTIPGNEVGVARIWNAYSEMGVDVSDDQGGLYHVSGHANRPDLIAVHKLLNPQIVVPMHGEHRHLREHVKLAKAGGRTGIVAPNGAMVELSGNDPRVVEYVETGRVYLDGAALVGALDGVVRERIKMALNGHVAVVVIVDDEDEALDDAWVQVRGLPDTGSSGAPLQELVEDDIAALMGRADRKTVRSDEQLEGAVKRVARKTVMDEVGKKPEVTVLISRLVTE